VSFAEIFLRKSIAGFQDANYSEVEAYRYSTLAFFGGFVIIFVLDKMVHMIVHYLTRKSEEKVKSTTSQTVLLDAEEVPTRLGKQMDVMRHDDVEAQMQQQQHMESGNIMRPGAHDGGDRDYTADAAHDTIDKNAANNDDNTMTAVNTNKTNTSKKKKYDDDDNGLKLDESRIAPMPASMSSSRCTPYQVGGSLRRVGSDVDPDQDQGHAEEEEEKSSGGKNSDNERTSRQQPDIVNAISQDPHNIALHKMGLLTALAIFIHNFPEGLATFVGTLSDTGVGIGIAVAIAVHNIPEGICVALPIYYSSGSKLKAFMWATASGMSEPLGALVGYFALYGDTSLSFAIVFALVAGMMVYISIKELIPMALRYDPKDAVTTNFVILGMVVMAASLLLFTL